MARKLPGNGRMMRLYGIFLSRIGHAKDAVATHMPPDTPQRLSGEIFAYQKTGQQAATDRKMAGLRHVPGDAVDPVLASFYARQGKIEPALQTLERARAARDPQAHRAADHRQPEAPTKRASFQGDLERDRLSLSARRATTRSLSNFG